MSSGDSPNMPKPDEILIASQEVAHAMTSAKAGLSQLYSFHFTALELRKTWDYRSYYFYRGLVSLTSALVGSGSGVFSVGFLGAGWEWALPMGAAIGTLVGWGQQQIEGGEWKERVLLIDALNSAAKTGVNEIPNVLNKGARGQLSEMASD